MQKRSISRPRLRHARSQRGVVLIVALIMLVVITMVSMSMVRSTTMEERMAGGARDRNKALQAAEYALRTCLQPLQNDTYNNTNPVPVSYSAPPAAPAWEVETNWEQGREVSIDYGNAAGLAENPRCIFEDLSAGSYRVTVRAKGASDTTAVILQATFSSE